ncbi:MAG: DUF3576 domain-containing protein [Pseudomonadota bacterium]|nr:DUF3576 domain-containing protein [Pseudomonadota bacterium]
MSKRHSFLTVLFVPALALLFLSGCSGIETKARYPVKHSDNTISYEKQDSIFGKEGLTLFDTGKDKASGSDITVNAYLWRATLDTVSFMPISGADPRGGVVLTDWYGPDPNTPERFKINVFILDSVLRADGIRVSVFRQVQGPMGQWRDATVAVGTARTLEDTILTRARQLKIAAAKDKK